MGIELKYTGMQANCDNAATDHCPKVLMWQQQYYLHLLERL